MSELTVLWREFSSLSAREIYEILRLRQQVFIVEQGCFYLDTDRLDYHALHQCGYRGDTLVAYARILPPGVAYPEITIGRIVLEASERGKGRGKAWVKQALVAARDRFGHRPIRISAQQVSQGFYEKLGFVVDGEVYDDAGIPHVSMLIT
jgi:ElaA protein